jgi:hypothetical protein
LRSGRLRSACHDGYDCFLFYYCELCFARKRAKYRDDIFERYPSDEPIEPEE